VARYVADRYGLAVPPVRSPVGGGRQLCRIAAGMEAVLAAILPIRDRSWMPGTIAAGPHRLRAAGLAEGFLGTEGEKPQTANHATSRRFLKTPRDKRTADAAVVVTAGRVPGSWFLTLGWWVGSGLARGSERNASRDVERAAPS